MTPESFNAALAQRKFEAADILLVQARMGSNPDRIRAASAILRIAFFPVPSASNRSSAQPSPASQAEGLPVHSRGQSDESSRSAAPGEPPNPNPTAQRSYSTAPAPTVVIAPTHTPVQRIPLNSS